MSCAETGNRADRIPPPRAGSRQVLEKEKRAWLHETDAFGKFQLENQAAKFAETTSQFTTSQKAAM